MKRLMLGLLLLPSLAQAALETNEWTVLNQAGWGYGGRTPEIDNSTDTPAGGGALNFRFGPAATGSSESMSGGHIGYGTNLPQEYYFGHWVKWSSNWLWHPNGSKIDYFVSVAGPDGFGSNVMVFVWGNQTMTGGCRSGIGMHVQRIWGGGTYSLPQTGSVSLCPGTWYWVESHVRANTPGQADGTFEFWINDVPISSVSNMAMVGPTQSGAWQHAQHSPEYGGGPFGPMPNEQDMWVDHTVISTTRIGRPGGSPPAGDTTAPSAPTSLTVN